MFLDHFTDQRIMRTSENDRIDLCFVVRCKLFFQISIENRSIEHAAFNIFHKSWTRHLDDVRIVLINMHHRIKFRL